MTAADHSLDDRKQAEPRFRRAERKKPVEILVGPGSFSSPFFQFFNAAGKPLKKLQINPRKTYEFKRLDGALSHPFFISDRGESTKASSALKIKGDGRFDEGISGNESFLLSFKKKARRQFADGGQLFYYCTVHPVMVDQFVIKKAKRNRLADPSSSDRWTSANASILTDQLPAGDSTDLPWMAGDLPTDIVQAASISA